MLKPVSASAGNASRPRNKLRPCSPFFGWEERRETGLTPAEWREFPRYALVRILMHAVKQSLRVGGFSRFVAHFGCFPSETPRASQAVLITDVMVQCENISLDKSFQEK